MSTKLDAKTSFEIGTTIKKGREVKPNSKPRDEKPLGRDIRKGKYKFTKR